MRKTPSPAPLQVELLPIADIEPHPKNPRRIHDETELEELTRSIQVDGIRQPLLVSRPRSGDAEEWPWRCVIGHRRLAAAKAAGLTTVPAMIDEYLTERDQVALMLVENVQRTNLTPLEEGEGYQQLLDLGMTDMDVASSTSRSVQTVRRRVALTSLPDDARSAIEGHQATLEDAATLEKFRDHGPLFQRLVKSFGTSNWRFAVSAAEVAADVNARWAEVAAAAKTEGLAVEIGTDTRRRRIVHRFIFGAFPAVTVIMRIRDTLAGQSPIGWSVHIDDPYAAHEAAFSLLGPPELLPEITSPATPAGPASERVDGVAVSSPVSSPAGDDTDTADPDSTSAAERQEAARQEAADLAARDVVRGLHREFLKPFLGSDRVLTNTQKAAVVRAVARLLASGLELWFDQEAAGIDAETEWEEWIETGYYHLLLARAILTDGSIDGTVVDCWRYGFTSYPGVQAWYQLMEDLGYELSDVELVKLGRLNPVEQEEGAPQSGPVAAGGKAARS